MSSFVSWEEIKKRLPQRELSAEDAIRFAMGVSLSYAVDKVEDVVPDDLIDDCTKFVIRALNSHGYTIVKEGK